MRQIFSSLLSILFLAIFAAPAHAALIVVAADGEVTVNVLAKDNDGQPDIVQNESLKINDNVAYTTNSDSKITLKRIDEGISLSVLSENDTKTLDVSRIKDNVVEIEARPETEKLAIRLDGNDFLIEQPGVVAKTSYEITVDPAKARLMLDAPSGNRTLSVTPRAATQTLLRAKTITDYDKEGAVTIIETGEHELAYEVKGKKVLNFFNFYYYPVDVTSYVSALTGEIVSINQPIWLEILGFLFA